MNLSAELRAYLPADILERLQEAGAEAARQQCRLYLIGGSIRDMLLPARSFDWDLDLVSDSPRLPDVATTLAERWEGQLQHFPQYGTAVLKMGELDLDFARARTEHYAYPGANPEVAFASLSDDIIRRDFSINAMALNLWPTAWGELYDPFDGYQDLKQGILHALHEKKFIEDPVRAWRAVRLSLSLNFELEAQTQTQLQAAMASAHFDGFFSARVRNELYKILGKEAPNNYLKKLSDWGVLRCLDPGLNWGPPQIYAFERAAALSPNYPENELRQVYILILFSFLKPEAQAQIYEQLQLARAERQAWEDVQKLQQSFSWENQSPAEIYFQLKSLSPLSLHATQALQAQTALDQAIDKHRRLYRFVKTEMSGKMLLGYMPAGPAIRELLDALLRAKLNAEVQNLEEEQQWVAHWLKKNPQPPRE